MSTKRPASRNLAAIIPSWPTSSCDRCGQHVKRSGWHDPSDGFASGEYFEQVVLALNAAGVGVVDAWRTERWEFVIELDHALAECVPWWDADEFRLVWRVNEESDPLHRGVDEGWHGFHAADAHGPAGWHWLACMDGKTITVTALDHPERRNTSMGPLADPADVAEAAAGLVRDEPQPAAESSTPETVEATR